MRKNFTPLLLMVVFVFVFAVVTPAQIQRSIVNPGFEDPFVGPHASSINAFFSQTNWILVDQSEINGWRTTELFYTGRCPDNNGYGILPYYDCTPIELWSNNFGIPTYNIPTYNGVAISELVAYAPAKLYQNVCFANGEDFPFSFAHHGRNSANADEAALEVGSTTILDVKTKGNGTIGTIVSGGAVSTSKSLINTWTKYSGTYTYTGASSIQAFGLRSVYAYNQINGDGNLVDDVLVTLKPFVELTSNTSKPEGETGLTNLPKLRVVGVVPAGGSTITLNVGGTATYGTDYNFTNSTSLTSVSGNASTLTFTIPAGNYTDAAGNNSFLIPVKQIDDNQIEPNETVTFSLPNSVTANNWIVASTLTCGVTPIQSQTHTIANDDTDLQIAKSGPTNITTGTTGTYNLLIANSGPIAAGGATFSDPVPTNLTGITAACSTATGGASGCTVSVSGNSVTGSVSTLPSGATQLITVSGTGGTIGSFTNTATVTPPSLLDDPNCTLSPVVCSGNNVSSFNSTIDPLPPNIGLVKSCSTPANCTASNQPPGTELTYRIAFTNSGGVAAANLILLDPIPTYTDFKVGSATINTGTTGATFVSEYSNDYSAGSPGSATWTYTPVSGGGGASSGFDKNVKAIRWRETGGTIPIASPNNMGFVTLP